MPKVVIGRTGVRTAPRDVPTDTTTSIMPMTFDRVGKECPEDEAPTKVSSVKDAFESFKPQLNFKTTVGEEGTAFVAELDFKSLADFDPRKIRSREPGKRNDLADLQARIDLLHRMRERFTTLPIKRAWDNAEQRKDIIDAVGQFEDQLRRIADQEGDK